MSKTQQTGSSELQGSGASIKRNGSLLTVTSPVPSLTSPTLTARRLSARTTEDGRIVVERAREPLLETDQLSRPCGGMAYPVALSLIQRGQNIQVHEVRQRSQALPEPSLAAVSAHLPLDLPYLIFLRLWASGVIVHDPSVSVWWLIAQTAFAWPAARISVIVTSKKIARRGAKRLRSWGLKVSQVTARYCPNDPPRIVIATPIGLAHAQIEHEQRDLVFYVCAADVAQEQAQIPLLAAEATFGFFGFLSADRRISPYEDIRVLATFGVPKLRISSHGRCENPVTILWQHFDDGAARADTHPLSVKRFGIWRHRRRNRIVKQLALSIIARDGEALRRLAPSIASSLPLGDVRGVAVLCGNGEHLTQLAGLLSGWQIGEANPPVCDDLHPDETCDRVGSVGEPGCRRLLLTSTAMKTADLTNIDVVIWAGSGPTVPEIPADRLHSPGTATQPLWIIDLHDHHHPLLSKWSRQRREAYTEHGWLEPGVAPERILIERVMSRQEVRP